MSCMYYAKSGVFGLSPGQLIDNPGSNQCGYLRDAHSPCQMEQAGETPDERTCPLLKTPSRAEIQRAHDILHFLGTEEAPPIYDGAGAIAAAAAHDALAWILGFQCGDTFVANIEGTVDTLRKLGFAEMDVGRPIGPEEQKRRGL